MSIFSREKRLPYTGWLIYGIEKLNKIEFATIYQYDEKNELDNETKKQIDSASSKTAMIFFLLNVAMLGPEGKCKIHPYEIEKMTFNALQYYFKQRLRISESDAAPITEKIMNEVAEYLKYLPNNMKNLSDFSYCCCKKYADSINPSKINVHDMNFTVNEGNKKAVILKYAKYVFEAIEKSVNNSLFLTSGKKIKLVSG